MLAWSPLCTNSILYPSLGFSYFRPFYSASELVENSGPESCLHIVIWSVLLFWGPVLVLWGCFILCLILLFCFWRQTDHSHSRRLEFRTFLIQNNRRYYPAKLQIAILMDRNWQLGPSSQRIMMSCWSLAETGHWPSAHFRKSHVLGFEMSCRWLCCVCASSSISISFALFAKMWKPDLVGALCLKSFAGEATVAEMRVAPQLLLLHHFTSFPRSTCSSTFCDSSTSWSPWATLWTAAALHAWSPFSLISLSFFARTCSWSSPADHFPCCWDWMIHQSGNTVCCPVPPCSQSSLASSLDLDQNWSQIRSSSWISFSSHLSWTCCVCSSYSWNSVGPSISTALATAAHLITTDSQPSHLQHIGVGNLG